MKTATIATLLLVFALPSARPALAQRFTQTNLVSDLPGAALRTDANLVNPWGLAPGASGVFWVANNATGTSTLYDPDGTIRSLVVTIPGRTPTGIVATAATDSAFDIPNGATTGRAAFIFVSQEGTISAWSPAVNATNAIVVESDTAAVYTGAALGGTRANPLLYVADFKGGSIETYDSSFAEKTLSGSFTDPNLPAGYAPFNIANIGGQLYVTYATHTPQGEELTGPGLGIVSVFSLQGNFIRRFSTGGELNAPWAIVQAPAGFGPFGADVLVGNFGDGRILAYDRNTGVFQGAVLDTMGNALELEGLWGLAFGKAVSGADVAQRLYFAAGINDETHGLFGYIAEADSDSTSPPPTASCENDSKGAGWWKKVCGWPWRDHGHGKGHDKDGKLSNAATNGDGDDDDDEDGDGPRGRRHGVDSDSLGVLFACIQGDAAPNTFGAGGCFTAGCDLLRKVGKRSDSERAAQVLLLTRLNLCSGTVCDSLAVTCLETRNGVEVTTLGEVADSLDVLLCGNGDANAVRRLTAALSCVLDGDDRDGDDGDDDDQGEDEDSRTGAPQRIVAKVLGLNPVHLANGPVRFTVNATSPSMVQLRIYDVRGRLVAEPMRNTMIVGSTNVAWDGLDFAGKTVVPGVYFYRAVTGAEGTSGRLLIVR